MYNNYNTQLYQYCTIYNVTNNLQHSLYRINEDTLLDYYEFNINFFLRSDECIYMFIFALLSIAILPFFLIE